MTVFNKIKQMSEEEFIDWLEDFAEAYTAFWICPPSECDFSHREADKQIEREWLRSEYNDSDEEFLF